MSTPDPYCPPTSPVHREALPPHYLAGNLTPAGLRRAGWLSVVYLLVSLPLVFAAMTGGLEAPDPGDGVTVGSGFESLYHGLEAVSALLSIYLLLVLRSLLEQRFGVQGLAGLTTALIVMILAFSVLSPMMASARNDPSTGLVTAYLAAMVIYGVILMLYGSKIVRVQSSFPYLRQFGWLTVTAGLMLALVVFAALSVVLGVIWDAMLAVLFFAASRELANARSAAGP